MSFILLFHLTVFLYRIFEIVAAFMPFVIISLPLAACLAFRKLLTGVPVFKQSRIYGKGGGELVIKLFNLSSSFHQKLFLFYHVIRGELAITGLSLREYGDKNLVLGDGYLLANKPGIFNLWYVRESSKIAHEGKQAIEWEYVFRRNFISDLMLMLKSLPAYFYHEDDIDFAVEVNLFDIIFKNYAMGEAVEEVMQSRGQGDPKTVYYVNPDCFNKMFADHDYFNVLQQGDYVFPDGIGVHVGCKILRTPLKENINGTDMFPFVCRMAEQQGFSLYLLGGKPGVADKMGQRLQRDYPALEVAGVMNGYFDQELESREVVEKINSSGADLLFVAFGAPLQEKWIAAHKQSLQVGTIFGVGGLFDFVSGNIKRAPRWMREIGMEWFYRFTREPGRMWKRYFVGNPLFILRVLRWKYFSFGK